MTFIVVEETLNGLVLLQSNKKEDARGAFSRLFCEQELRPFLGEERRIVQINHSTNRVAGTVRGMHYQRPPYSEMKLVRCLRGAVWDVAVDLRAGSRTFLNWYAVELTPENKRMLVIPEGFAHGFQVLTEDTELLYLHTKCYRADAEGALAYDDPVIGIEWPISVCGLSERDRFHPHVASSFSGIEL